MPKLKNGRLQKKKKHLVVMVASKKKSHDADAGSDTGTSHQTRSRVKPKESRAEKEKKPPKKKSTAVTKKVDTKVKASRPVGRPKKKIVTGKQAEKAKRKAPTIKKTAPPAKKRKLVEPPSESSDSGDDVPLAEMSKFTPLNRSKINRNEPIEIPKQVYELPSDDEEEEVVEDMDDEDEDDGEDDDDDLEEEIPDSMFYGPSADETGDSMTCSHCKGKFQREELHDHMSNCPERYVQCRECGKVLSNLQTLERHHKRFHLKLREVPCTICAKKFIDEAASRKHLKTVHFKVKNFHCPNCDKSFSQRNKLTYHIRTHSGEKPFSCTECGRAFSLLWNLKTHLRTHTGEKPYGCDVCGRRFTQKQNMTSHMTTHRKKPDRRTFPTFVGSSGSLDMLDSSGNEAGGSASALHRGYVYDRSGIGGTDNKQGIPNQAMGGQYFMDDLGNLASITRMTTSGVTSRAANSSNSADDQSQSTVEVNLENGLGLLSSVARKGDGTVEANGESVQVDGIVTFSDHVNGTSTQSTGVTSSSLDQLVEVFVQSSEANGGGHSMTTMSSHVLNSMDSQDAIVNSVDSEEVISAADSIVACSEGATSQGEGGSGEQGNLAGLANILQNPQVLAAINAAASTNKFIVIGPVGMFGQDGTLSSASGSTSGDTVVTSQSMMGYSMGSTAAPMLANTDLVGDGENAVDLASLESQLINAESIVSQADSLSQGTATVDMESGQHDATSQEVCASTTNEECSVTMPHEVTAADTTVPGHLSDVQPFDLLQNDLNDAAEKLTDHGCVASGIPADNSDLVSSEVSSSLAGDVGNAVDSSQPTAMPLSNEIDQAIAENAIAASGMSNGQVQNFIDVQELISSLQRAEDHTGDSALQPVSFDGSVAVEEQPQPSNQPLELTEPSSCVGSTELTANEAEANIL